MLDAVLQSRLLHYQSQNLYRTRKVCDEKEFLTFCSNDYLGLSRHPKLIAALAEGAEKYGVGSGASSLVSGYSSVHESLERSFAKFLNRDRAILFTNGYMANIGVMQALIKRGDTIYQDRLNHASLLDAGKLTGSTVKRYHHGDTTHLEALLASHQQGQKLIVTDGVFSMDGDFAPLSKIAQLAKKYHAWLMVDDAHGIGLWGSHGSGTLSHYHLDQNDVPILVCPLGKAFGSSGAIVAGSQALIESLVQFARTYIYTTAISPAIAHALKTSLELVSAESWRRDNLQENIAYLQAGASSRNLIFLPSASAIQSFIVGPADKAQTLSQYLLNNDILVTAIRPPTVPEGTSRLRITINALHTFSQIDTLLNTLAEVSHDLS